MKKKTPQTVQSLILISTNYFLNFTMYNNELMDFSQITENYDKGRNACLDYSEDEITLLLLELEDIKLEQLV